MRNNQIIKRDSLIRQVASIVGSGHRVDLRNPDVFILVEVYKVGNIDV
jgi:tRNA acetyltransferase TAN1